MKKIFLLSVFLLSGLVGFSSITVNPSTISAGNCQHVYSQKFLASGGTGPYTYSVSAGALPSGLFLSSTGVLYGTIQATNDTTASFTIRARDARAATGTRAYILTITNLVQTWSDIVGYWGGNPPTIPTYTQIYDTYRLAYQQSNSTIKWAYGGNTVSTAKNIGTIDSVAFPFITKNVERMRISATGNVGIGTNTPVSTLHLVGSLKYVDGNQGASKVLTSDAAGVATWQTITSGWALNGNTVGSEKWIGTIDNYEVPLRVNNVESARFKSHAMTIPYSAGDRALYMGINGSNVAFISATDNVLTAYQPLNMNSSAFSLYTGDANANFLFNTQGGISTIQAINSAGNVIKPMQVYATNFIFNTGFVGVNTAAAVSTEKFNVTGYSLFSGSGSTNATYVAKFLNSSNTNNLSIANDGTTVVGDDYGLNALISGRDNGAHGYTAYFYGKLNNAAVYGFGEGTVVGIYGKSQSDIGVDGEGETGVYGKSNNSGTGYGVQGIGQGSDTGGKFISSSGYGIKSQGKISMVSIPHDSTGLSTGDIYVNATGQLSYKY